MPTVMERINVSVDTGDLDQRLGGQIAKLQQVVSLIARLVDDPPDDVGDLLELAGNLPLPELDLGGDFAGALDGLRGALPADLGDLTGAVDGNLGRFANLIPELRELLAAAVGIAAAVERLVAIDFSCPTTASTGGGGGGGGGGSPTPSGPGADRMARTAQQTQQVNDLLDRLPPSPTAGGLLEFFLPIIHNRPHPKLAQLALPVLDDVLEPLHTLSRWAALDATAIGAEIEATLTALTARLRAAARGPLDALSADLAALAPQLDLPGLTGFANAYRDALNALVAALEGANPTAAPVAAMNLALDDAGALLGAWDATVAADTEALDRRLRALPDDLLDRLTHLLTLLEPVELPRQLVDAIPAPQPPDPAAVAAVQAAVQPVVDWLNELVAMLDFSALQGPVTSVATEAQAIADAVEQGLTGVALEVQALFDRLGEQVAVIDLNGLKTQLEAQIARFGGQVERQLSLAIAPASDAIAQAVQALSDALDGFDPEDIVDALRGVLSAITGVLQSGEVADAITAIRNSIDTLAETLEPLSFAPVTDEVIALIDQMTKALKQVQQTDLNDAAKAALAIALQVLPEDLTPVTDPLLDDVDGLIENGPLPLLTRVADKPAELLGAITRFQPGALIGDQLGAPYRDALGRAEGFRPSALFAALDGELAKARGELVRQAAPSRALAPLRGPFDQLKGELRRYSPEALLAPLEQRIEDAIKEVAAASPVDEIFATVDRVFALIESALDVPRNLVETLTRIDTLLGHLADPDAQIDGWRDGLLDKVFGVTNLAAIGNALTDLNSALADTTHAALLARLDTQTQALRDALATYDPGRRVTALVSAHNRARRLVNALPDGAEKTAALAALDRFDPGRAAPLRLTRKLDEALGECRKALAGLAADWQELAESPQGVLAEIAAATADADGLRALVASAIEPPLAPLRHLFRLLASVQPAVAGMLATLTDLVDSLTTGVAALTTGPGSLQAISDAAQQVVDTLRNIDLRFLREGLQGFFIQLLDQLDALNPAQIGAALDAAFASVLEAIDLDSIIPAGTLTTLDASYDTTLDKLRALDPQALIVEVVQPDYDATVGPLVAAFDLSPVFDALIELLHGLREELGSELGRVNGAYQGLRAARPSLGSINVNISF